MSPATGVAPSVLAKIEQAIRSLRFGTVQVTVHDAQVVQIEKVERVRISVADRSHVHTPTPADRTPEGTRL